jgi:DinB family protein
MNRLFRLGFSGTMLLGMLFVSSAADAQTQDQSKSKSAAPTTPPTVTVILDRSLSGLEREFVPAAEAMPDEKFSFAPTAGEFKGVRTFGEQVRHVAATNYALAAGLLQEKPPVDLGKDGDEGPTAMTSKADIIRYLKDSFAYAHRALATVNEGNVAGQVQSPFGSGKASRLGLSVSMIGHSRDHYGQMVEYLRMNGIIPPASRQQ